MIGGLLWSVYICLMPYFYHIFNHANGIENLFRDEGNYVFFLHKVKKYISPHADLLSYCLMPNHFHLLISTDLSQFAILKQATNLTISYAKSYNKLFHRKGALFLRACKIKLIEELTAVPQVIMYIHRNPIHHGFETMYTDWAYSSYHDICAGNRDYISCEKSMSYFGDTQNFKIMHQAYKDKLNLEKELEEL